MADSKAILASWQANADAWVTAVREQRIDSRRVTNAAVLDAIKAGAPRRVLDVGCGEGWLCRALHDDGIEAVGVDATAPLIGAARADGAGRFEVLGYDDLVADPLRLGQFDGVVFNFALFEADPSPILRAVCQAVSPEAGSSSRPCIRIGWRARRGGARSDLPASAPRFLPSCRGISIRWRVGSGCSWMPAGA